MNKTECSQKQQVQMTNESKQDGKTKQPTQNAGKRAHSRQQPDWLKRDWTLDRRVNGEVFT